MGVLSNHTKHTKKCCQQFQQSMQLSIWRVYSTDGATSTPVQNRSRNLVECLSLVLPRPPWRGSRSTTFSASTQICSGMKVKWRFCQLHHMEVQYHHPGLLWVKKIVMGCLGLLLPAVHILTLFTEGNSHPSKLATRAICVKCPLWQLPVWYRGKFMLQAWQLSSGHRATYWPHIPAVPS